MKKTTINTNKNSDFHIIGIITNQKDYTLAWYLNNILELNFSKINNKFSKDNFSFYKQDNNNLMLIENKNSEGVLFSDLKKFNFLLKINNLEYFENFIKSKLKTTNDYIFSGVINKSKLIKKTQKLISEIQI